MKNIAVKETLNEAWALFRERPWFLFGISLTEGFLISIITLLLFVTAFARIPLLFRLPILILFAIWLYVGKVTVCLGLIDRRPVSFKTLFSGWRRLWPSTVIGIRYNLNVVGLSLLLLVPGIIFALKYCFCQFLVIERGLSSGKALDLSALLTEGYKTSLLKLGVATGLIRLLAWLPFSRISPILISILPKGALLDFSRCAGVLVFGCSYYLTASITLLAILIAYRQLERENKQEMAEVIG
ncbi:MAG TPA: hypothetical protein DD435_09335 [Cyanobacteria bacterium UBA8530]|nr:hypothetical protein [Cyanobacteria bacterium UBA8530]